LALGVQPGEHVGIWSTNRPEWVISQFATAQIGAALVNINPAYRTHELEYILRQADISTLILTDQFKDSKYFDILEEVCPQVAKVSPGELNTEKFPKLRRVIGLGTTALPAIMPWDQMRKMASEISPEALRGISADVTNQSVVNLQYTSGTTGFPKGVQLTHRNLLMNVYYVGRRMRTTHLDRICIPVPFYHCFGCVLGTLLCVTHGASMIIPAEVFTATATLTAIQDEQCTAIYGVPTMFIAQLEHPEFQAYDLSSLRTGIMAGSPCPIEVMRRVVRDMGASEITIAYGLTEASPVITQTRTTDPLEIRVSTVGQPMARLEVKTVIPGTEDTTAPGETGELMVRGHCVMKGYYRRAEDTAEAITPDGWLHTGDLADCSDGFYRITGRIKDMVVRGGENIYPREIEEFLFTHPAIIDVQVVGLPDQKYGEELSAWIQLKPDHHLTKEAVASFCKGKISHFKIPIYIFFVDSYPTTVTGKIQKFKLRELGIKKLKAKKFVKKTGPGNSSFMLQNTED